MMEAAFRKARGKTDLAEQAAGVVVPRKQFRKG